MKGTDDLSAKLLKEKQECEEKLKDAESQVSSVLRELKKKACTPHPYSYLVSDYTLQNSPFFL